MWGSLPALQAGPVGQSHHECARGCYQGERHTRDTVRAIADSRTARTALTSVQTMCFHTVSSLRSQRRRRKGAGPGGVLLGPVRGARAAVGRRVGGLARRGCGRAGVRAAQRGRAHSRQRACQLGAQQLRRPALLLADVPVRTPYPELCLCVWYSRAHPCRSAPYGSALYVAASVIAGSS